MPSKKGASKPGKKSEDLTIDNGRRHEVEVQYQDGMWYRDWLSSVNVITGKWMMMKQQRLTFLTKMFTFYIRSSLT